MLSTAGDCYVPWLSAQGRGSRRGADSVVSCQVFCQVADSVVSCQGIGSLVSLQLTDSVVEEEKEEEGAGAGGGGERLCSGLRRWRRRRHW